MQLGERLAGLVGVDREGQAHGVDIDLTHGLVTAADGHRLVVLEVGADGLEQIGERDGVDVGLGGGDELVDDVAGDLLRAVDANFGGLNHGRIGVSV